MAKKNNNSNIYMPHEALISDVSQITHDVKLFTLELADRPSYGAGQFFMVSVTGRGEVPISVTSTPEEPLRLCIRMVGHVTAGIHALTPGDRFGIRGPYGRCFPLDMFASKRDVIVIAGGLGIVPLRPLIKHAMRKRKGKLYILSGSRTPSDIIYRDEINEWAKSAEVRLTVDRRDRNWRGRVGLVTELLNKIRADFSRAVSFVCGPEIMIKSAMAELSKRGMPDENIFTTLEAHMKCGIGKCGHCYMGPKFVCTDGPVFSLRELKSFSGIPSPGPCKGPKAL